MELSYFGANVPFFRFGHRGHGQVGHTPSFMCHLSGSPEAELEKLCSFPKSDSTPPVKNSSLNSFIFLDICLFDLGF